ncbi:MAG TPA: hypothetical protein VHB68_13505, partial [Steroidobacteraceae bacterium]|nr:hypothetical protein [Steroidobacteraceae bacterium]
MKLATLEDGTRNGKLLVVAKDLRQAVAAPAAPTLLDALENWGQSAPRLQQAYEELNAGSLAGAFSLDVTRLAAPLPRAPQWLDASAFHSHGDLMDKVFGMAPIEGKLQIPLMYQGASDDFIG